MYFSANIILQIGEIWTRITLHANNCVVCNYLHAEIDDMLTYKAFS